jgi:hypothetical protein
MLKRLAAATIAALAAFACAAPTRAACTGTLAPLLKYAGGDAEPFLAAPAIATRMATLMGPVLDTLKDDLMVAGPVGLVDCDLVVEGNAPHQGGERDAILDVNVYSGAMTVGIQDRDRVAVLAMPPSPHAALTYDALPAQVRDWTHIAAARFRSRIAPPPGLTILPPQGR